jgi:LPS-assembly protein
MKNKFVTFFLVFIFVLCNLSHVLGEEFIFEVTDLEITEQTRGKWQCSAF